MKVGGFVPSIYSWYQFVFSYLPSIYPTNGSCIGGIIPVSCIHVLKQSTCRG